MAFTKEQIAEFLAKKTLEYFNNPEDSINPYQKEISDGSININRDPNNPLVVYKSDIKSNIEEYISDKPTIFNVNSPNNYNYYRIVFHKTFNYNEVQIKELKLFNILTSNKNNYNDSITLTLQFNQPLLSDFTIDQLHSSSNSGKFKLFQIIEDYNKS